MLCGQPPFNGSSDKIIMDRVSKGVYGFQSAEWKQVSQESINFIKRMLEFDPLKRISAELAIKDPWIMKYGQDNSVESPLMLKTLENMQTFRAGQKLQEASWMFLVQYFTTREEKSQLIKKFQAIDTNGDGVLSRDELIEAYRQFKSEEEAIIMVDEIMKSIDKNNNGSIDYTEFVMATCNRQHMLSKDKLEVAFKIFDKDGSGALDISELKEVFSGANVSDEVWNELVQEVDENNDGQIQFAEFKKMMMRLVESEDANMKK
eukprot:TRINITY_DN2120_c0_g1_i4.p2 TRINITY_DN2120_c0_g1~~TRINITY_DN2120_c0_g1_i4.p2  ORF type:complete len:262 (+),score=49.50 TRINITY_DN2120_c0_g1_i4:571-1356(+)